MKQNRFVLGVFLLALNSWCNAQDLQYSTNRTSGVSVALNGVATGVGPNVVAVGTNSAVSMGSVGANGLSFASNEVSKTALNLTAVAYGSGMFVAGATNGDLFTSADGAGWTAKGSAFTSQNYLGGLAFNSGSNGTFVAVADGIPLIRWADAQLAEWHAVSKMTPGAYPLEYYYGVTALSSTTTGFAVCGSGGVIRLSQDAGRTWTVAGTNSYEQKSPTLLGIASGGGKLACVGTGGRTMVSSDGGSTWASTNPVTANLNGVAYTGSGFIAVGDGGLVLSSPDGAVWTKQTSQTAQNLYGVAFALSGPLQGVAVVVGAKGTLLVGGVIPPAPTSLGNQTSTYGSANPPLSVSVAPTIDEPSGAATVDWFDAEVGGSQVWTNSTSFTPTNILPGTYVYYAQARDTRTEYINTNRTAVSLTINPAPLTITANDENKTYGSTFTPNDATQWTITSGSLFYSDSVTGVTLTSSGYAGTATVTAPGPTYAIVPSAATGSGLGNYTITYANGTFTVNTEALTITASDESKTYGSTFTPNDANQWTIMSGTLFNGDSVASVTLNSGGYAGTATVTAPGPAYAIVPSAAVGSGLGNYTIAYANGTFTVNTAPLTITANNESKTYGSTFTPNDATQWTITSGTLFNSDTVASVTLNSGGYAGTATVAAPGPAYAIVPSAATGSGLGNYTIAYANGTFTVNTEALTITASDENKTYGSTFTPVGTQFTITSGTLFNSDSVTGVTLNSGGYAGTATVTAPGPTYAIVPSAATGSGLGNYTIAYANGTFTVNTAALTITASDESKTYGSTFTPNDATQWTITSGSLFNSDSVTGVTLTSSGYPGTATVTAPGPTYAIVPSAATGSGLGNYNISYVPGTLTVGQAALTITANDENKTYGSTFTPNDATQWTITSGSLFNSDSVTGVTLTSSGYAGTATVTAPGPTYAIVPSAATGSGLGNYNISYVPGTLMVGQAALTITASNESKTYGSTFTPAWASQVTVNGLLNTDTVTGGTLTCAGYVATATYTAPGPSYSIAPSGATGTGLGNYNIGYVPGTLTVGQAALTITATSTNKVYGAPLPTLTASYAGFVNGDTNTSLTTQAQLTTTATNSSPVGTYPITAGGASDANYTISYVQGTLTVTAAPLTVTANDTSRMYGATNPVFTGTIVGVTNNDSITATYTCSATTTSLPGQYPIVPSLVASSITLNNYSATVIDGQLTITVPAITNPTWTTNRVFSCELSTVAGVQYTLLYTVSLPTTNWIQVMVLTSVAGGTNTFTDSTATDSTRFYRIGMQAP